jgi:hypothetical protein
MRIYEGNFAYEIEQVLDPATLVSSGWRYKVYRVRPVDELLRSGEAESKEAATQAGRRELAEIVKSERAALRTDHKPAA